MNHLINATRFVRRGFAAFLLVTLGVAGGAVGAEPVAADLLPPTTVIYVELAQPAKVLEGILEHPLRHKVESLDGIKSAMQKKNYLDFKAVVAIVESQMTMPWNQIVSQATGGGVALAVDSKTGGVALLAKATDETTHPKLIETLTNLARLDATRKGEPDPIQTAEYRGIQAYGIANAKIAVFDQWLLICNKEGLGKAILDQGLDKSAETLAADEQFKSARTSADGSAAWAYVNTKVLRDSGVAKRFFKNQADNAAAELLFGGILSNLQHTPYITAALKADYERVELALSAPHDRSWAGETREHFFGPQGLGQAPAELLGEEALFTLSTYRDISTMWLRAGDLFDERQNEELAKADSNLTTLFAGKDFGEDILGALRPELQIVVTRQSFANAKAQPAIKLPTFALVADLKDPEKMQPELRRTFQSLIGFLNIVGAMNGQPQLEQDIEKTDEAQILISRYIPDANAKDPLGLKINYNFSPTIAFVGNRFIVSSSEELARKLINAPAASSATNDDKVVNTNARVNFAKLKEILADNEGQLIAQNMLKEGHSKEEAEKETKTLLDLIGWFDHADLRLETTAKELRVTIGAAAKAAN